MEEKKQEEAKEEKKEEPKAEVKKAEEQPPPPQEIVLRVYMHCEGCARKVRRCLKGFEGPKEILSIFPHPFRFLFCLYVFDFGFWLIGLFRDFFFT